MVAQETKEKSYGSRKLTLLVPHWDLLLMIPCLSLPLTFARSVFERRRHPGGRGAAEIKLNGSLTVTQAKMQTSRVTSYRKVPTSKDVEYDKQKGLGFVNAI